MPCVLSKACNRARARAVLMGAYKRVSFPFQLILVDLNESFRRWKQEDSLFLVVADWFGVKKMRKLIEKKYFSLG